MKTGRLIVLALMIAPALAHAALVNINTADAVLLDTLPGIGVTYATRIVDYRTAHGPFLTIEDIQNVSGIGPSTFSNIKPFITVGAASTSEAPAAPLASTTPVVSGGAASNYVPPPTSLTLEIRAADSASLDVPLVLTAHVTTKGGATDTTAQVLWSFGDGSSASGFAVEKTYRYAGTYLITASATDGSARAKADITVTVVSARVRMLPVTNEGVTLANDSVDRLDLSAWRLLSETGSFRFPEGTAILPGARVLFPSTITNLPFQVDMALLYPDGIVAARAPLPVPPVEPILQLQEPVESSHIVQTDSPDETSATPVDTITSGAPTIQKHVEAVLAPAAAVEPAAAGAAPVIKAASGGIFRSPWTLSLLGVIAAAGGAFILL